MSREKQNILSYLKEFKNRFYYHIILVMIYGLLLYRKNNDIKNVYFNVRSCLLLFTTKISVQEPRGFNYILSSHRQLIPWYWLSSQGVHAMWLHRFCSGKIQPWIFLCTLAGEGCLLGFLLFFFIMKCRFFEWI